MSPYKLKYRVISQSIKTGIVDKIFDDYERAMSEAQTFLSDNDNAAIDLLLIGPGSIIGDIKDRVLYKQSIFAAKYANTASSYGV